MSFLLLAVEIPESWIVGIATFLTVTVGPSTLAFLKWAWKRETTHQEGRKADLDKQAEIHAAALKAKDEAFIEALKAHAAAHAAVLKQVESEYDEERDATRDRYKGIIDSKDAKIEDLSKEISRKSDHHAQKIEELMLLTLAKVESLGDKNLAVHERTGKILNEFVAEVRRALSGGNVPPGRGHEGERHEHRAS